MAITEKKWINLGNDLALFYLSSISSHKENIPYNWTFKIMGMLVKRMAF